MITFILLSMVNSSYHKQLASFFSGISMMLKYRCKWLSVSVFYKPLKMQSNHTSVSLLDRGALTPDLTTPEQDRNHTEGRLVRRPWQHFDSFLTPPSSRGTEFYRHECKSDNPDLVYIPVNVDIDSLHDWNSRGDRTGPSGAQVRVNNTDIALFKHGENVIATQARCPHAGGPLYQGEIEELPDRSLCVKCPWHRWSFCVGGRNLTRRRLFTGEDGNTGEGSCVWPPGRGEEGVRVKVYPTLVNKMRKTIKIGFENINDKTLLGEAF